MKEKFEKIFKFITTITVTVLITVIVMTIINQKTDIKIQERIDEKVEEFLENASSSEKLNFETNVIKEYLNNYYIGNIDEDKCIEQALKGYVEGVGDEYTQFLTEEEYNELLIQLNGNYSGIGIYLGQDRLGNVIILGTFEDSPASKAGIKSGDIVIKIDDLDFQGEDLDTVANKIKGKENTKVKLELLRDTEIITKEVTRKNIEIKSVKSEMLENNIGYIKLISFDEDTKEKFEQSYIELKEKGAKSIIIDLRDNGGGLVDTATSMADMFVQKGDIIMKSKDKNKKETIIKATDIEKVDLKVIVLANENSASASEILIGALKDNNIAKIVGTTTFGKGVMQEIVKVTGVGYIKVTIEEFLTPNGDKINKNGIKPDYKVENPKDESSDSQLQKAIDLLK